MTEIANLGGKALHEVLISAANSLENNKTKINDLNVFPVPDGDTGTNMGLTIGAVREVKLADETVSDCASKAASAILRSARGNSGAILALFFRGFSKAVKGMETADVDALVNAFALGKEEAYKAVMNPAEGTILTVIRRCAEDAPAHKDECGGDLVKFFTKILSTAEKTLEQTPEMLPILKEAHVVDAGGAGFVMILRGILAALRGTPVESAEQTEVIEEKAEFSDFDTEDIKFSYCTEFIVEKSEKYLGEDTASALYERIADIGDSIVFVDAEDIVKVHIHTNHPGAVLEAALLFGMFAMVKIENMKKQHSSLTTETKEEEPEVKIAEPTKRYGFVSVCMGDGIRDMFRDFNVDEIVFGGQTMNPSMQDILDAVNKTPAETVYVLPNNKNIDMVAMQAAEVSTEKNVIVIHTKSVPEGISALLSFDENVTPDENTEAMSEAISLVKSLSVTHAVRDACIDGIAVRSGQAMGMLGGKIRTVGNTSEEAVRKMLPIMKDASYITIFYGEEVSEWEAGKVENMITEAATDAEVVLARGGQPLYDYIISVE
ncbi:MAG: DAK2 domain-containing protein [Clostridia bacterium]|nr:DAK2 domain-containing protein [Clostridia bacterium]